MFCNLLNIFIYIRENFHIFYEFVMIIYRKLLIYISFAKLLNIKYHSRLQFNRIKKKWEKERERDKHLSKIQKRNRIKENKTFSSLLFLLLSRFKGWKVLCNYYLERWTRSKKYTVCLPWFSFCRPILIT